MNNLDEKKDIDKYIEELLEEISVLRLQLEIINNWLFKDWLDFYDEKIYLYEQEYEKETNKLKCWAYFIYACIFEPKWYQFCVYLRTFFEALNIYFNKDSIKHKKNPEMWESSKNLKAYIDLIFHQKKYKNKIFNDDEIKEELKEINSHLSEPLHGFSYYFEHLYSQPEIMNKDIKKIVNLLINNNTIRIDLKNKSCVKEFLDLIKNSCQKEFNKLLKK